GRAGQTHEGTERRERREDNREREEQEERLREKKGDSGWPERGRNQKREAETKLLNVRVLWRFTNKANGTRECKGKVFGDGRLDRRKKGGRIWSSSRGDS
ncbi:hypothetical protein, partial [Staphylococcus aureus]